MPGPTSDSYDPEFGTGEAAQGIRDAIDYVYDRVSHILRRQPPMYILDLVKADLPKPTPGVLSEKDWRIIRFALERAKESI